MSLVANTAGAVRACEAILATETLATVTLATVTLDMAAWATLSANLVEMAAIQVTIPGSAPMLLPVSRPRVNRETRIPILIATQVAIGIAPAAVVARILSG